MRETKQRTYTFTVGAYLYLDHRANVTFIAQTLRLEIAHG